MTILLALALVLSLGMVAVPMAGTTEAGVMPTVVWVDDDFTASSCGGHTWNYNASLPRAVLMELPTVAQCTWLKGNIQVFTL